MRQPWLEPVRSEFSYHLIYPSRPLGNQGSSPFQRRSQISKRQSELPKTTRSSEDRAGSGPGSTSCSHTARVSGCKGLCAGAPWEAAARRPRWAVRERPRGDRPHLCRSVSFLATVPADCGQQDSMLSPTIRAVLASPGAGQANCCWRMAWPEQGHAALAHSSLRLLEHHEGEGAGLSSSPSAPDTREPF